MTPNDSEIELLIRRHATGARHDSAAAEHLDADELNAFAEGSLPVAARSGYVSHLADCRQCRQLASQLSIHAGAVSATQSSQVSTAARVPWWKSLSNFIAPPALRYAAFAVVLVAVVGITFLVWRRSDTTRTNLVAQNQPASSPVSAVKTDTGNSSKTPQTEQSTQDDQSRIAKALPQPTAMPQGQDKPAQIAADAPAPPPRVESVRTMTESEPSVAARSAAPARADATPSFAPPPPEANEAKSREQNVGGITHGGPKRSESSERYKVLDRNRSADATKEEDRVRGVASVDDDKKDKAQPRQASESGTLSMSAGANRDERSAPRKSENKPTPSSEAASATRSVGGRKFQRQGSAWVDVKFKSSMSVRNLTRGSDEFASLDSRLRSIAQQLGGEVIVVWKGKAYRIQ